ncbi:MAG: hypothetical protein MJ016_02250 [Victivallaceae bacterium]|nr:hypothetical protein [Victivallaceae bacterium]
MQVRLYSDQIGRLGCDHQATIRAAVRRYHAGEIVVKNATPAKIRAILPLSVSTRFDGIDDALLRQILDAHFAEPEPRSARIAAELQKWDAICREMLDNLPPFIIERAH